MIPWSQIISASVTLADVAHSLYKKTKKKSDEVGKANKKPSDEYDLLVARVQKLELLQIDQADISQQLANQNKVLIRKIRISYFTAIVALLVSIAVVILNFGYI